MLCSWFLICFCCGSVWVASCLIVLVGMQVIKAKKTRLRRAQKTNICSLFYCIGILVVLTGDYLLYAGPLDCALLVDEEPAIRTNTTILLGNIGSYLNEGVYKKRVLINAFTVRALRDTFPPARGAGIMALCATSSYYDITEVATRILANVVVLTIDPNRTKAFQAIDQLLQIAKQHYEKTNATDTSCGVGSSFVPGNASLLG
ncbi:hypothetical protein JHK85_044111 [Glycine max]|nr:hypothetical protein JHK85_044111 [Glycine max]